MVVDTQATAMLTADTIANANVDVVLAASANVAVAAVAASAAVVVMVDIAATTEFQCTSPTEATVIQADTWNILPTPNTRSLAEEGIHPTVTATTESPTTRHRTADFSVSLATQTSVGVTPLIATPPRAAAPKNTLCTEHT